MTIIRPTTALIALSATLLSAPAFACSSCGCNLTSDWLSQGLVAQPGTTVSLRYDYVPQTQLRAGTHRVDGAAIGFPNEREIELHTYNHYATLTLDHAASPVWAFNLQIPFLYRPHGTIAEDTVGESRSRTGGLGDVRATARFQGFGGAGITGIQFGLKLPTGRIHQRFRSGPIAGEEVDRGLQPGTGTVDAILGAYHFGKLGDNFDYMLQAQGEAALGHRDSFRPGAAATVSAGVQYVGWSGLSPEVQLNFRAAQKDHGDNADRPNSGGEHLYVTPGVSAAIGSAVSAYAFVQLPLYRRIDGLQLVPGYTVSVGLQYRL